jgi:hypothetical protein
MVKSSVAGLDREKLKVSPDSAGSSELKRRSSFGIAEALDVMS